MQSESSLLAPDASCSGLPLPSRGGMRLGVPFATLGAAKMKLGAGGRGEKLVEKLVEKCVFGFSKINQN